jgi:dihydroorotase
MIMQEKRIDPHVHCRDWKQGYKATIKSVTNLARSQGVSAIFDMPNTDPLIISKKTVQDRIYQAEIEGCLQGYYFYIGATNRPEQIREAADIATNNPKVVGIKYFTTGNNAISLTKEWEQRQLFNVLSDCNYKGVVVAHCEKESLFKRTRKGKIRWNPQKPWTWNDARPVEAEVAAVEDQGEYATDAGFGGILHTTHVSTSKAGDVVDRFRKKKKIRATCGVTPQHLLLSTSNMRGNDGIFLKVNTPLRDKEEMLQLRGYLKDNKIDWVESDNAPHDFFDKVCFHSSGIQGLRFYQSLLHKMREWGIPEKKISDMTYYNIKKAFPKVVE